MKEKELVELTNKVYRQTLLFPKREPLRYKVRETADDILRYVVEWEASKNKDLLFEIEKNLKVIKAYLNIVKWQNWVSYFDIIRIELEYDKVKKYYGNQQSVKVETVKEKVRVGKSLSAGRQEEKIIKKDLTSREKKILDILKQKEKVQVGDIKEIMKDVSKRTLRRDFDDLLKQNLVERVGQSNETYYVLVR